MKRTFKILSIVMVAVILLTASAISVSAYTQLPDGGQITNCGEIYTYGYTSGGALGKTLIECQSGMYNETSSGGAAAQIITQLNSAGFSCSAYQSLYLWDETGTNTYSKIVSQDFETTYIEDNSYIVELYSNNTIIDKATAGHRIIIPGYGTFVAGTTVYPYD